MYCVEAVWRLSGGGVVLAVRRGEQVGWVGSRAGHGV